MKAAVFYGKNDLRVEERDVPEIGRNDVLVRVHACGICTYSAATRAPRPRPKTRF